jgi:multidrug efflux pump
VLPAVYVAIATDHRAGAESQRAKEIADFDNADLPHGALKPT